MSDLLLTARARQIVAVVATRHYCTPADLESASRETAFVRPRQLAMYVLRHGLRLSYPAIGRLLHRDHTTVLHSLRVIEADPEWREEAMRIMAVMAAEPAAFVSLNDRDLRGLLVGLDQHLATGQALRKLLGARLEVSA